MKRKEKCKRAYLVMGINQLWAAKRYRDGRVIAEGNTRGDTKAAAERLGYKFERNT